MSLRIQPKVYAFTLISTKRADTVFHYFLRNGPFPSFDGVMYAVVQGNGDRMYHVLKYHDKICFRKTSTALL